MYAFTRNWRMLIVVLGVAFPIIGGESTLHNISLAGTAQQDPVSLFQQPSITSTLPSTSSLTGETDQVLTTTAKATPVKDAVRPSVPLGIKQEPNLGTPSAHKSPSDPNVSFTSEESAIILPLSLLTTGDSSMIKKPSVSDSWASIMTEGFEGAWPAGNWATFDNDGTTNGEYCWDDESYLPHSASWSGWAAGGCANGLDPAVFYYPNNVQSWAVYGPFDLRNADDAELLFWYWNQSEVNYDYFGWYASTNGYNFWGTRVSGDSGGWQSTNFDLTNVPGLGDLRGSSSIWIAYVFTSDSSNVDDGPFIDDIVLQRGSYKIYLPVTTRSSTAFFNGPWEVEPNNNVTEANGPLISGQNYYGYPNDQKDYFSFYMGTAGNIHVTGVNYTGGNGQMQLFYQTNTVPAVKIDTTAPFDIVYTGSPGWYYIYINTGSNWNNTNPYTLRVTYP